MIYLQEYFKVNYAGHKIFIGNTREIYYKYADNESVFQICLTIGKFGSGLYNP